MRSFLTITTFLLLMSLSSSCTERPATDPEEARQEIIDIFVRSEQMFEQKDVEALVDRFTPDGMLRLPGARMLIGTEQLRENYAVLTQYEDFRLKVDVTRVDIAQAADMAYVLADYSVTFQTPGGPFTDQGQGLITMKRIDKEWKIAAKFLSSGVGM